MRIGVALHQLQIDLLNFIEDRYLLQAVRALRQVRVYVVAVALIEQNSAVRLLIHQGLNRREPNHKELVGLHRPVLGHVQQLPLVLQPVQVPVVMTTMTIRKPKIGVGQRHGQNVEDRTELPLLIFNIIDASCSSCARHR